MEKKHGEKTTTFVLRIEAERRRLGADKKTTYRSYVSKFDRALKSKLDTVRWSKKASGNPKFGWDDVVTVCRDVESGCALDEEGVTQAVGVPPPPPV